MRILKVSHEKGIIRVITKLENGETVIPRYVEICQEISGVLCPKVGRFGRVQYVGSDAVSLHSFLKTGITNEQFFSIVEQIFKILKEALNYGFSMDLFLLGLDYVFIRKETCQISMVYQPIISKRCYGNVFLFFNAMIRETTFANGEDTSVLVDFLQQLQKMENFSIEEIEEFISKAREKLIQEEKENITVASKEKFGNVIKHTLYYNDSAQEAEKKYLKSVKTQKIIVLLIMLPLMIFSLYAKFNYHPFVFFCIWTLLWIILIVHKAVQVKVLNDLLQILCTDCEPVKMCEVLSLLILHDYARKSKSGLMLYRAASLLYIPDRLEEGFLNLQSVHFKKKSVRSEGMRIYVKALYGFYLKDRKLFNMAKSELLGFPMLAGKKVYTDRTYQDMCQNLVIKESMWDGKYEEVREMLIQRLSSEKNIIGRVCASMELAELDMKRGEYNSAKNHLLFVITYGSRMPLVRKAIEMMEYVKENHSVKN